MPSKSISSGLEEVKYLISTDYEYDENGQATFHQSERGAWWKWIRGVNEQGNRTLRIETSYGFWSEAEYDSENHRIFYNSSTFFNPKA